MQNPNQKLKLIFLGILFFSIFGLAKNVYASDLISVDHWLYKDSTPFLWVGDTAWFLMHATYANADTYLTNRQSNGFSVVQAGCTGWDSDPNIANADGVTPFASGATDVGATRNSAYWTNISNIINNADNREIHIGLLPMNANNAQGNTNWLKDDTTAYGYGFFLGSTFTQDNVIWILGGDSDITYAPLQPLTRALARGIADGNADLSSNVNRLDVDRNFDTTLITFHPTGCPKQTSSSVYNSDPWLDFNMIQTNCDHAYIFTTVQSDYSLGKVATLGEGLYYGTESGATAYSVRQEAYWSFMAGGYYTFGSIEGYTELKSTCCHANVVETLDSPAVQSMAIFKQFLAERDWYNYTPDQSLILSGASSGASTNAAVIKDNISAMVYLSVITASVQIDLGRLNATGRVRVARINTATGVQSIIGEYDSGGSRTFDTGGLSDAVILFDAVNDTTPPVAPTGLSIE